MSYLVVDFVEIANEVDNFTWGLFEVFQNGPELFRNLSPRNDFLELFYKNRNTFQKKVHLFNGDLELEFVFELEADFDWVQAVQTEILEWRNKEKLWRHYLVKSAVEFKFFSVDFVKGRQYVENAIGDFVHTGRGGGHESDGGDVCLNYNVIQ